MPYFDYAAATPPDPKMWQFFADTAQKIWANPSSLHRSGQLARATLEQSRRTVAGILQIPDKNVIFTASASEANNMVIEGMCNLYSNPKLSSANPNKTAYIHPERTNFADHLPDFDLDQNGPNNTLPHFIISEIEHSSVVDTALILAKNGRCELDFLPIDKNGIVQTEKLNHLIRPNTVLVSIILVSNEIGTIQPIDKIGQIIARINIERAKQNLKPIKLHTDAVQAANYLDIDMRKLQVDFMTLSGHKIYAPRGSAILAIWPQIDQSSHNFDKSAHSTSHSNTVFNRHNNQYLSSLHPHFTLIRGGGQEKGWRSGTENVPTIAALATALVEINQNRQIENKRLQNLQSSFIKQLLSQTGKIRLNGMWLLNEDISQTMRICNNIHLSIENLNQEYLLTALDLKNIQISAGSACQSQSLQQSRIMQILNRKKGQSDFGADLRITLGKYTTWNDLQYLLDTLLQIIQESSF